MDEMDDAMTLGTNVPGLPVRSPYCGDRLPGDRQRDGVGESFTEGSSTVLIVEDNPDLAYLWERYLSITGIRALSTRLGTEAIELAEVEQPAAVILDIMLPGMNGWEVLQELRANCLTHDIPVIMCSALDEEARGLAAGASAYLRKPVSLETFLNTVTAVGVGRDHP